MTAVSPGSGGTPNSGEPPQSPLNSGEPARLPLRWAIIIGITAAVGIACFAAGGISVAIVSATAVAVALHQLLA